MKKFFKERPSKLDDQIDRLLTEMDNHDPTSPEYTKLLVCVERLTAKKQETARKPMSTDALLSAGASILGILIIVGYEQKNVVTSKAFGLITKMRN